MNVSILTTERADCIWYCDSPGNPDDPSIPPQEWEPEYPGDDGNDDPGNDGNDEPGNDGIEDDGENGTEEPDDPSLPPVVEIESDNI